MPLLCCCCCCYCFMLLLSWNCHCAYATTDESQQQQQQYYTVITIIKQLMTTKILNNICRFICMLLLLLCLLYVIWKDLLWSKAWNVNEFKFAWWIYFGWWTPSSIKHGSLEDHYTIWQTNLLWEMDPLVNWTWISGRPLHQIIFITDWTLPPPPTDHRSIEDNYTASVAWQTDPTTLLQSTIDPWKTTTPHKFHIWHNAQVPWADLWDVTV